MSTYIKFTEDQLAAANRVSIVDLMRQSGYRLKREGSEYAWESPTGKVTIRGNQWYHQYEKVGGKAIGFLVRFHDMEFVEAVKFLLSEQGLSVPAEEERPKQPKTFELPPKHSNMNRVYEYLLNTRFLDREIVDYFAAKGLIYEDAKYHNAVFVGLDNLGIPKHASKRGTASGSTFKGNVYGSDDRYCFHYTGPGVQVFVFESPIDLLAYLSLHKENWEQQSYITLCSAASEALVQFLKDHPQVKVVHSCLDHDKAGIEGFYRIKEQVKEVGEYKVDAILPKYKDWNERLKADHGITPLPAAEHPGVVRMRELCLELVGDFINDPCPKYPMAMINDRYQQLKRLGEGRKEAVLESAYALSGAAFLFVRKLMRMQELEVKEWELAKFLFATYEPHRDNIGYRSRITSMGERLTELKRTWGYGGDKTKTELLNIMELGMKLAVDGLRLCMYMEQEQKKMVTKRQKQEGNQKEESAEQEETEGELCMY